MKQTVFRRSYSKCECSLYDIIGNPEKVWWLPWMGLDLGSNSRLPITGSSDSPERKDDCNDDHQDGSLEWILRSGRYDF
mgnify:FL=1